MKILSAVFILTFSVAVFAVDCGPKGHWVRAFHRNSYTRGDGTFVSDSNVTAHCQGNPKSYDFWHNRLNNQRPTNWPDTNKKEKLKIWSDSELERVYEALDDLPEVIWLDSIMSVSRMDKSIYAGNHASSTPGHIVLYDTAFEKDQNLARIMAHELAHEYYGVKMSVKDQEQYNEHASWYYFSKTKSGAPIWRPTRQKYVAPDGDSSPTEDFANNLEFYLFNKAKLRDVSPEILEWIEYRFGDKLKLRKK